MDELTPHYTFSGEITGRPKSALKVRWGSLLYNNTYYVVAIFPLLSLVAIALCAIYAASTVFGFFAGDALPTATIFRLPFGARLAHWEEYAPFPLLIVAAAGAVVSWLGAMGLLDRHIVRRNEVRLWRFWHYAGLPVLLCTSFFSLSAAGWSGFFREVDFNYFSMLGIVPHSDAFGYVEAFYENAATGHWSQFGARRPVAQALRDLVLLASGHSYLVMLSLQAVLVSASLFIAARSIARWRGIWPTFAFAGLVWIIARPFVPTASTEPLALVLTLVSMPFLIEAYGRRALPHILIALLGLSIALLARMGNLFLIPLMVALLPFGFTTPALKPTRLVLIGLGVACLGIVTSLTLIGFYSPPGAVMGGNFVWTLCGLASGTNWGYCWDKFFSEATKLHPNSELSVSLFVFAKSMHIFVADPSIFFRSVSRNMIDFVARMPHFYLNGYMATDHDLSPATAQSLTLLTIPGIAFIVLRRMSNAERWFWSCLLGTTILAAGLVFADDGTRVLIVTNVMLAYLIALGFASPSVVTVARPITRLSPPWRVGAISFALLLAALIAAPAVSRAVIAADIHALPKLPAPVANQVMVLGGRYAMGFIVVADDDRRLYSVPAIRLSEFDKLFTQVKLFDNPPPLLARAQARVPFAFLCSPGSMAIGSQSGNYYIAPPEILQERQVKVWRLRLDTATIPPSSDIRIIEAVAAESVLAPVNQSGH